MISVAFLSGACASCLVNAEDFVKVFAFNLNKAELYYGPKDSPKETIGLNDPNLEKAVVCLYRSDWTFVKNRLATCKSE